MSNKAKALSPSYSDDSYSSYSASPSPAEDPAEEEEEEEVDDTAAAPAAASDEATERWPTLSSWGEDRELPSAEDLIKRVNDVLPAEMKADSSASESRARDQVPHTESGDSEADATGSSGPDPQGRSYRLEYLCDAYDYRCFFCPRDVRRRKG